VRSSSCGAKRGTFAALRAGASEEPKICWGIDLFVVIAELAGLDLEDERDSEEATVPADNAPPAAVVLGNPGAVASGAPRPRGRVGQLGLRPRRASPFESG